MPQRMKIKAYQNVADSIASLYTIPIPLIDIANDEEIKVIYDDYGMDTFDGMTWYEPSQRRFFIHINTERGNNADNTKGRFTLAHELGHYFIDHHRHALETGKMQPHIHCYNQFGKNEEWIIEREADNFAANLLMPKDEFMKDVKSEEFSGQMIQSVASKYNVSFSACAIRYMNMNLVPTMLVYAVDGKIKWQMRSDDFPFYMMRYGKTKVPENTVMGDYFYKGDSSCGKQSEVVFAGDCFHTYKEEQNGLEFYEYCIPFGKHAFSVFWEK